MRLHRFIGDFDLSKKELKITNPEITKQIKGVLRLEIGDKIILGDGSGRVAEATIIEMTLGNILVSLEKIENVVETGTKVNLYLAILKKENFELAVQKAVETGVSNITPVITERTVKTGLNTERLIKIIREASEQSGRSIVPTLSPILDFEDALKENILAEEKIILNLPARNASSIADAGGDNTSYSPDKKIKTSNIFIGPEGGFTEKEIGQAKEAGYAVASLGQLTLRGETAAIVATYRAVNRI